MKNLEKDKDLMQVAIPKLYDPSAVALNENQLLISSSKLIKLLISRTEIGQVLSLYKDSDNLSKTSQSSMRQVFGSLSGTDGGMFVGLDVNTKEVF